MSDFENKIPLNEANESNEQAINISVERLIILFVFFGSLIGAILREVNKKYKIPYAPMLLFIGVIWGYNSINMGIFGDAINQIQQIDPYGILIIFIPTLIFESAFNFDWYLFKKKIGILLFLAGPGILINILLAAFCLKILLGYASNDDLSWSTCLMIGSIVSCADPIAIGSFLQTIGASGMLKILLEGEALINGGCAMIFFHIFANISRGIDEGFIHSIAEIIYRATSGPILGLVFGLVSSIWLQRITQDNVLSITISYITCYLLFFCAERFETSGILSVVTLGLFYSAYSKTKVDLEADYALHSVWSWAHYACKTMIFLITGSLVGYQIIFNPNSIISYADIISVIGFYIAIYAIRLLMILALIPFFKKTGDGVGWREVILLTFGNLRGTLSLARALMVGVDLSFPERVREMVVFHVSGVVILSLLVNSTLSTMLVKWLGIESPPEIKRKIQKNFLTEMYIQSKKRLDTIKNDKSFSNVCDWNMVQKQVGFDVLLEAINRHNNVNEQELIPLNKYIESRSAYNAFEDDEVYCETRFRLLRILRGLFWEKYEACQINADVVRILVEGCNSGLDDTTNPINLWQFYYEYFTSFKSIKFFFKIKNFFIIGRFASRFIANHLAFIYEVTTTFIKCSQELSIVQGDIPISKDHIKTIMEELDKNIYDANNYICTLEDNFIEIIKTIQIKRASTHILLYQKQYLNQVLKRGQIDEREYNDLRKNIDRKLLELDKLKVDWKAPSFTNFIMEFPIFSCLKQDELDIIISQSRNKDIQKGQLLYEKDLETQGLYIITRGIVKELFGNLNFLKKSIGSVLSFANLTADNNLALTTCEAITNVQATIIPIETLRQIMSQNLEFEEKCYKNSVQYLVALFTYKNKELSLIEELSLNEFLKSSKLRKVKEFTQLKLPKGGFLFHGDLQKILGEFAKQQIVEKSFEKYSYIPPTKENLMAMTPTILIEFTISLSEFKEHKHSILAEDYLNVGFLEFDTQIEEKIKSLSDDAELDKRSPKNFNLSISDDDPLVS